MFKMMYSFKRWAQSFSEKWVSLSYFLSMATTSAWYPSEIVCKHANKYIHLSWNGIWAPNKYKDGGEDTQARELDRPRFTHQLVTFGRVYLLRANLSFWGSDHCSVIFLYVFSYNSHSGSSEKQTPIGVRHERDLLGKIPVTENGGGNKAASPDSANKNMGHLVNWNVR